METVDDNVEFYVGKQIRYWRMRRGLSQEVLADMVGISRALVGHYETGERELDSRERLYRFAEALQVPLTALTQRADETLNPAVAEFHAAVPRIEAALMCAGNADMPGRLPDVHALVEVADEALALRAAAQYTQVGGRLPDLITGLYQHTLSGSEEEQRLAWGGLTKVMVCTALATTGLGYAALGWIAANAALEAAERTGTAADLAAAAYIRAQAMLATPGAVRGSLAYTLQSIERITPAARTSDDRELLGMLHLHAGLSTAATGYEPTDHLAAADDLAAQTGEGSAYQMHFGPGNVSVWRMSMALEQRRGGLALQVAETLDPSRLGNPNRQARYFIELARAQFMEGDLRPAAASIRRAETIAPQQVRTRNTVRELVGQMMRKAQRDLTNGELGSLAQRVGAITI